METGLMIQLSALIVLLLLSSFFSSAETALTTVRKIRIQAMAEEGNSRAEIVLKIISDPAKMLSTILIGNNIVNLSASALTTTLAIRLFGSSAVTAATAALTLFLIIFGEISPKNMAAVNAESMSLRYARVILLLMHIMTPVIFLVNKLSRVVLRIFRVDPDARPIMTESELRTLVDVSNEDGVIENDERQMINNVVDLNATLAREIMIPRIDMTAVPITLDYDGCIQVFREHHFTRIPVYTENSDNIVGVLNIKDLLLLDREGFSIESVMAKPYFTYEAKNISDLLDEMRLNSLSIVIVLDEYGSASGIITMEDVLEEIVGDIHDEYQGRDAEEITVIVPGREYTCLGSIDIDDFNEVTGLELSSEDYDSIGGYIIEHSEDNLPKVGEYVIPEDGTKLIVEAVRKNRILRVHVYISEKTESDS
ncbi:MAG: hemolysin family protein [Lachnospiraceae bacterium]|nr:hemolysin family protein [Lachnospiraceae bacterium]